MTHRFCLRVVAVVALVAAVVLPSSLASALAAPLVVEPTGVTLQVPAAPVTFGTPITVRVDASCPAGATGLITITDSGRAIATADLQSGAATLTLTSLQGGSHVLVAKYPGTETCAASSSPMTAVTVERATPTMTLTTDPTKATVGQRVVLSAKVNPVSSGVSRPTGTVVFSISSKEVATAPVDLNGNAVATLESLPAGAYLITARYQGDASYVPAQAQANAKIDAAVTETKATSLTRRTTLGQPVQIDVVVAPAKGSTGTPTGTVELRRGSKVVTEGVLSNGKVRLTVDDLLQGDNDLVAAYLGDGQYAGSASTPLAIAVSANDLPDSPTTTVAPRSDSQSGVPWSLIVPALFVGIALVVGGAWRFRIGIQTWFTQRRVNKMHKAQTASEAAAVAEAEAEAAAEAASDEAALAAALQAVADAQGNTTSDPGVDEEIVAGSEPSPLDEVDQAHAALFATPMDELVADGTPTLDDVVTAQADLFSIPMDELVADEDPAAPVPAVGPPAFVTVEDLAAPVPPVVPPAFITVEDLARQEHASLTDESSTDEPSTDETTSDDPQVDEQVTPAPEASTEPASADSFPTGGSDAELAALLGAFASDGPLPRDASTDLTPEVDSTELYRRIANGEIDTDPSTDGVYDPTKGPLT